MTPIKVALVGNPNTGKTSVFNELTGLNHKVGNYPGITVEKKLGSFGLENGNRVEVLDLPGLYSLNTTSLDEEVALNILLNETSEYYPDVVVLVADVANLKRNLILYTQIKDLGLPCILAINMSDVMQQKGISLDVAQLERKLQTSITLISARKHKGFEALKSLIQDYKSLSKLPCLDAFRTQASYFSNLKQTFANQNTYKLWLGISQNAFPNEEVKRQLQHKLSDFEIKSDVERKRMQQKEIIARYTFINDTLKTTFSKDITKATGLRAKLDRILIHKVWGYVIFAALLLLIFQTIFNFSSAPMDFIDNSFAALSEWISAVLPDGQFTRLIAEGIIPGIGGVVIFIPQIAFLFLFIGILEETGYMSRIVFLTDRVMKKFGLSGKSIVPFVSGTACAIPAVMASRNIESWKERLITILVIPFTTCSARLPVYLIIISIIIPEESLFGIFNYQGLTLFALYTLGFGVAVLSAWGLHKVLKIPSQSTFIVEMPEYKTPIPKNVFITVYDNTKSFVLDAGKIILALSIILWVLGSYGPNDKFSNAEDYVSQEVRGSNLDLTDEEFEAKVHSYKLNHSFIGYMGKGIEPIVEPLGYDWKIGIAVISSFAARELFVSTLATIYSVGTDDEESIRSRLEKELNEKTGEKRYDFPTGISLLLFYAFAMQCLSTLAVVKKETNSWKWPVIQLVFMSIFAYIASFIAYQLLQ